MNWGNSICVNDEQPEKQHFPIFSTEEGITICSELMHLPIDKIEEGIFTPAKDEHPLNVKSSILSTDEGISFFVKDETIFKCMILK